MEIDAVNAESGAVVRFVCPDDERRSMVDHVDGTVTRKWEVSLKEFWGDQILNVFRSKPLQCICWF